MHWVCHVVLSGAAFLAHEPTQSTSPPAKKPTRSAIAAPKPSEPSPASTKASAPVDKRPAAMVDGVAISVAEVNQEVAKVLSEDAVAPDVTALLQAQALAQLIDRRLILRNLSRTKVAADPREVDVMIQRLVKQLEPRKIPLEEYLRGQGIDESGLRHQITWRLSWGRYLERYLSEENLARYFEQHRREFDGSRLRVAHILLKPRAAGDVDGKGEADKAGWTEALDKAKQLREKIVAGELTFEAAAKQHSAAPTAAQGGDIGLIGRREPMPESFSKAAFALEKDQISPPVASAFGVHLIRCLEIQPGQGQWSDSRDELEKAMTQYLFRWLADKERTSAKVEFTGATPHFRPGTEEVAPAMASPAP